MSAEKIHQRLKKKPEPERPETSWPNLSEGLAYINERFNKIKDPLSWLADIEPQYNYAGFSFYSDILPYFQHLLSHIKKIAHTIKKIVIPQDIPITGPLWNYLDAACSLVTGIIQLLDSENHRWWVTKLKGLINISNSAQLTALTKISFATLGGPGFAIAFGTSWLLSFDPLIHAARRYYIFNYWLKDILAELSKKYELINNLDKEIKNMAKPKSSAETSIYNSKKESLKKLEKEAEKLENDIIAYLVFKINEEMKNATHSDEQKNKNLKKWNAKIKYFLEKNSKEEKNDELLDGTPIFQNKLRSLQNFIEDQQKKIDFETFLSMQISVFNFSGPVKDYLQQCQEQVEGKEKEDGTFISGIRQTEWQALLGALKDNFILFLAFSGMALICFPFPPCQAAGIACITLASSLYIAQRYEDIILLFKNILGAIKNIENRLFTSNFFVNKSDSARQRPDGPDGPDSEADIDIHSEREREKKILRPT